MCHPGLAAGVLLFWLGLLACTSSPVAPEAVVDSPRPVLSDSVALYTYEVVQTYPHDPGAFTQGLTFHAGELFEGTGLRGRSSLRRVGLQTGEVLQQIELESRFFGEGIAVYDERVVQLTWTSGTGFVYDRDSFELQQTFAYDTQGWGITYDGARLIMSDGTAHLYFLDPETFERTGSIEVRDGESPVRNLNELEYVDGRVMANVWLTDRIAVIDPDRGAVISWIDLSGLLSPEEREQADVLNGIAFDPVAGRLVVTGKLWPKLFEIRLVPEDVSASVAHARQ